MQAAYPNRCVYGIEEHWIKRANLATIRHLVLDSSWTRPAAAVSTQGFYGWFCSILTTALQCFLGWGLKLFCHHTNVLLFSPLISSRDLAPTPLPTSCLFLTFLSFPSSWKKCINFQLFHYLDLNSLMSPFQSGFWKFHCTEMILVRHLTEVFQAVDHAHVTLLAKALF